MAEKRVQKVDGSVEITAADAVDRSGLTVDSRKWYLCKTGTQEVRRQDRREGVGLRWWADPGAPDCRVREAEGLKGV